MKLYEIDAEIQRILTEGVDPDTGEISQEALDALDALEMERTKKLENVALAIKQLNAEADAYWKEEKTFNERRRAALKRAERLSAFLSEALRGEKLKTDRALVTFRKTAAVKVENEVLAVSFLTNKGYTDCLRVSPPEINKNAVKRLLDAGVEVPGTVAEERLSMQIK